MADEQDDENVALPSNRSVLVIYGSETGNSQDLAEDLERLYERLHFDVRAHEMNDVELVSLAQRHQSPASGHAEPSRSSGMHVTWTSAYLLLLRRREH